MVRNEGEKVENFQISHILFSVCLAINMKGCIRNLYFVSGLYSQTWLNLCRIEQHFFYIVLRMITTWATTPNFVKLSYRWARHVPICNGPNTLHSTLNRVNFLKLSFCTRASLDVINK